MHRSRVWGEPVEVTLDELADKLTRFSWTGCTAWRCGEYVFVNDATGGDGGQEYAVLVREGGPLFGRWFQVESWTASWMTADDVRSYYAKLPASSFRQAVEPRFEKHSSCAHCA